MIVAVVLLVMAVQDFLTMKVNDILQIILLICAIYAAKPSIVNIIFAVLFLALYIALTYYKSRKNYNEDDLKEPQIGGADIKIVSILLLFGINFTINVLFWASLFAIIYGLVRKIKKIPFVPFLLLGYLIVYI